MKLTEEQIKIAHSKPREIDLDYFVPILPKNQIKEMDDRIQELTGLLNDPILFLEIKNLIIDFVSVYQEWKKTYAGTNTFFFDAFWRYYEPLARTINMEFAIWNDYEKKSIVAPVISKLSKSLNEKIRQLMVVTSATFDLEKARLTYTKIEQLLTEGKDLKIPIDSLILLDDLTFENGILDDAILDAVELGLTQYNSAVYIKSSAKGDESDFYTPIVEDGQYYMVSYNENGDIVEKDPVTYRHLGNKTRIVFNSNNCNYISLSRFLTHSISSNCLPITNQTTGVKRWSIRTLYPEEVQNASLQPFISHSLCISDGKFHMLDLKDCDENLTFSNDSANNEERQQKIIEYHSFEDIDFLRSEIEKQFETYRSKNQSR